MGRLIVAALASLIIGMAGALALASIERDLARFPSTYARLQSEARNLERLHND